MIKILYVEDNDDNVYMLKLRFEMVDGFEMLVAEDGAAGCAKAIAEKPDVILMDLDLPVVDGWEASRQLKSNPQTRHIPIIAAPAAPDRQSVIEVEMHNGLPSVARNRHPVGIAPQHEAGQPIVTGRALNNFLVRGTALGELDQVALIADGYIEIELIKASIDSHRCQRPANVVDG